MNNILIAENITKKYGDFTALNNVSIAIPKQSVFGLLGPNGAGKTSLIRIINQITLPDSGQIILDGRPLQLEDVANIGYLPEERGLYKSMKVGEQALYLAQLKGMSKQDAKKALKMWFDKFEIDSWWDKKIEELSKGMAQKVQFITTVMHKPKLLIFDEPFSGFDPVNANLIKDEILALRNQGATIIFSTHRMESVEEMCDNIALIDKSNKILDGKLSEIKKSFRSNTFEVGLEVSGDSSLVYNEIAKQFTTTKSDLKLLDDTLTLSVELKDKKPNELIQYLSQKGNIIHFVEKIPSVNDIFIQAVSKK
jgi:ABC-2 type transport system ATP-binding protein